MWRILSLLVVVCLWCALGASAQDKMRIVESETKVVFEAGQLNINLVTENQAPAAPIKIKLEILNAEDALITQTEQLANLKTGKQNIQIPLNMRQSDSSAFLWYRLRYSIFPAAVDSAADAAQQTPLSTGIIALAEITPELFEIRASSSENVYAGMLYSIHVRAFHPITNQPTANVKISGELSLDVLDSGDDLELKAAAKTDREGNAILMFQIPIDAKLDDDGDLDLTAEKDGFTREANQDLDALEVQSRIYLNTDKPIYQPGQDFHARGLLFDQTIIQSKAAAGRELKFIVEDEDETTLYKETVKTSDFGITGINWKIPENSKLGSYKIRIKDADDELIGSQTFKVSRYDLPNFTVNAKPDKTYYLPGQNTAEITVSADYLFGKPVISGKVKVVREKDRHWNYTDQKWDVDEAEPVEGAADKDGKFIAKFDLSEPQKDLQETEYRRFEDLRFAAYYTDLTTNRTESRRFDVRVTKDAIHLYLVAVNSSDHHNPKLPVRFYVSTFYADGAPAACNVEIKGKYKDQSESAAKTLTQLKTNAFGAGRVEFTAPKRVDNVYDKDLQIKVTASDAQNQTGSQSEDINMDDATRAVQIRAKKTIYKNGEPLDLEILSSEQNADVFVNVVKDYSVIDSRLVKVKDGKADFKIPYREDFKGQLTIGAYIDDGEDTIKDSRGVIYPVPQNLRLDVSPVQAVYRPNEEAKVNFSVATPASSVAAKSKTQSQMLPSALGVVVFDKAIEERARTDADFGGDGGGGSGGGNSLLGNYGELFNSKSFGGISLASINEMDTRPKISEDLQLAAEALLADESYYPRFFDSGYYDANFMKIFESRFKKQFSPIEIALKKTYESNFEHPSDDASLRKILKESGLDFDALRDPWGNPYRTVFKIERDEDALYVWSDGADKISGIEKTSNRSDDFVVLQIKFRYFPPIGRSIDRAIENYHDRTGSFIRDYETLKAELRRQNFDLDALRDRWNHPYKIEFGISDKYFTVDFRSANADGKFNDDAYDDFTIWTNKIEYFKDTENRLREIFSKHVSEAQQLPKTEAELKEIFKAGGVSFDTLRDAWNQPIDLKLELFTCYADRAKTETTAKFGEKPKEKITLIPVTQQIAIFRILSPGADGKFGDYNDVTLASFSGIVSEQTKDDAKPVEVKPGTVFSGGKGAIRGKITDPSGAVLPDATITLINESTNEELTNVSDDNGNYLIGNIPSGKYTVKISSSGFNGYTVENVIVRSMNIIELNCTLQIGGVSAMVNVTAESAVVVDSTETSVQINGAIGSENSFVIDGQEVKNARPGILSGKKVISLNTSEENSTPRLREYFPETLVWQPELITDKNGKAEIKFKLGDNITTWKLLTIASNADGKVGIASKEIQAFQPFFVDLEPPKILTVGDEIALPVQVRNYTEAPKKVAVSMASGAWFEFLKGANQQIEVAPNATQNAIFDFRTLNPVKQGKQRVTAIAEKDSDAIEKPVLVHPDGQEIVRTQSEIFRDAVSFDVNFPAGTIPKTQRAELKIYPNLLSHVTESVEGILHRPYGCGEQTISSTYPNLMILKVGKSAALAPNLQAQAQKFLQDGYERLLSYQKPEGGFSIWTKDAADIALTAYAVRFLTDAREFIDVDENVIARASRWLISQQRADGSWARLYAWEKVEDKQRTKILTTYITRILAKTEKDKKEKSKEVQASLKRALDYLKTRNEEIDEPYALSNYALALFDFGDVETAQKITEKLRSMALTEAGGAYWNLETNTPFYGWGVAGRIETTALVVQALLEGKREKAKGKSDDLKPAAEEENLISRGTLFLLKNKDKYGVWYSTQTTINVLDALLASLETSAAVNGNQTWTAEVFVNGQKLKDVPLPAANALSFPINIALDSFNPTTNRVEVKISGNNAATMAQLVSDHYVGWQTTTEATGRNTNQSRQLRLDYNCDKKDARIMDEVNCTVEAERIGFKGYGMLLAEIGLPPGADVDRASLEKAKEDNWNFSRYDVLPDKIIVYLWSQAGGTKFNFKFRPRYGINAQTSPSIVYDYYNSEAQATLPPLKFNVK